LTILRYAKLFIRINDTLVIFISVGVRMIFFLFYFFLLLKRSLVADNQPYSHKAYFSDG